MPTREHFEVRDMCEERYAMFERNSFCSVVVKLDLIVATEANHRLIINVD